jgi:ribonuclease HII
MASPPAAAICESADSPKKRNKSTVTRRRRQAAKLFKFDRELGTRFVAGADEAGRGSLAGPLVAAAVLIDYERLGLSERRALGELDDSKKRSAAEREELYPCVLRAATKIAVTARCVRGIDSRGLHVTNLAALARCLERVAVEGATCLSDGFRIPGCQVDHRAVIDGDARSAAIAAASVIAKVTRDRLMVRAEDHYPGFGFALNAGYSTPEHRDAIIQRGPSTLHRRSFQSIAYSQLSLAGKPLEPLEGGLDPVTVDDAILGIELDADDVEAQRAVAGD